MNTTELQEIHIVDFRSTENGFEEIIRTCRLSNEFFDHFLPLH